MTVTVHSRTRKATYRKYTAMAVGHKSQRSRVLVFSDIMCHNDSVINSETGTFEADCQPRNHVDDTSTISRLLDCVQNVGK
jgi:hypothetical protein